MTSAPSMSKTEIKSAAICGLIFAFRMLGLFMIYPIFTLHATEIQAATPHLIGIALGIYGLTQAGLQLPLGMLSDRIGRKPVIAGGLAMFVLGSIVAASATSIYGIICGRALQGAGAVGSTLIAMVSDIVSESHRAKANAMIGGSIGMAFMLAMILGPLLDIGFGISTIFWVTAGLGLLAAGLLMTLPDAPRTTRPSSTSIITQLKSVITNSELLKLDFAIACQHAILTAMFVVLPVGLHHALGIESASMWRLYLPVMIGAFVLMMPMLMIAEKRGKLKELLLLGITLIIISQFLLWEQHQSLVGTASALLIFFTAFTALEAILPALVAKRAPPELKGTAIGIYSTSQFAGIFIGGMLGGWLYSRAYFADVYLSLAALAIIWLAVAFNMEMASTPQAAQHEAK